MRTASALAWLLCAVLVFGAAPARAEKVAEPATGVELEAHRSVEGRGYTLVGLGVRKRLLAKVYAMGLYVEDVDGKRAFPSMAMKAGGTDLPHLTAGGRAQAFVLWGQFGKRGLLHFLRDTSGDKVRAELEEGLTAELADKAPQELREATQAFLELCAQDVKAGDELELATYPDGRVELALKGERKGGVQSVRLARAIWGVWLGPKPVAKDLHEALVNRIDALAR